MNSPVTKLVYVGDPMCSWCWGFAPEIESLAAEYPVEVVVGGLRPGPSAQALEDRMASFLRSHWIEIGERTGQAFDTSFLDRSDGWIYDTEPAAIAVTVVRQMAETSTLDYFTDVQEAFYAQGRDVTDLEVLTEVASEHVDDPVDFRRRLELHESKQMAWADFSRARNWGITGFPTLVGELSEERLALLARGWTTAELIRTRIASLSEQAAG